LVLSAGVQAAPLFFEDFEGYSDEIFTGGDNIRQGVPLVSDGAKETWYGGRFETGDGGSINQDVAVRRLPFVFPDNITFGQLEDDAGILFKVSTLGVSDATLSFQWRTHLTESGDRFVAGYYVGDIDFVNDTPDGGNDDLVHRFTTDGPSWSSGGWVELLRDRDENSWNNETFALPAGQPSVWVAFWLDNGERDLGKVDNIVVTPEPATLALMGLAAVGLLRRRGAGSR